MANLATTYMGLSLKNPVVPSASPLSRDLDGIKRMEDAGAAAITLYSLFEEQIDREAILTDYILENQKDRYSEMTDFFPEPEFFRRDEMEYLDLIREAKEAVDIPVIPSLNGYSEGGWTQIRKALPGGGRRRDRAQRLLYPDLAPADGGTSGGALLQRPAQRQGAGHDSGCDEAQSVL